MNKEINSEEPEWGDNMKGILMIIALITFFLIIYYNMFSKQRAIDDNLSITYGKIIEHGIIFPKSGWGVRYIYTAHGRKYEASAQTDGKIYIDFDTTYVIEYQSTAPENSRIIINGKKCAHGVD